jgi:hypothetical protein
MRSADVRKLLNISPGTLQNLRINGTLTFSKVGGRMFYKPQDVDKMLAAKPKILILWNHPFQLRIHSQGSN